MSVYSPTSGRTVEQRVEQDKAYGEYTRVLHMAKATNMAIIGGDFNAQPGTRRDEGEAKCWARTEALGGAARATH